jgi:hypothetical protein
VSSSATLAQSATEKPTIAAPVSDPASRRNDFKLAPVADCRIRGRRIKWFRRDYA